MKEIAQHGAEHALLVVRGDPASNVVFYKKLMARNFGIKNINYTVQPMYLDQRRIVEEQRGKRRIVLVEATRIRRQINLEVLLDEHHGACTEAHYSEEDWARVLPVAVIHADWVYEAEVANASIRPLANGLERARREVDATRALSIELVSRKRRKQISEALEGIHRGELVHSSLPRHPLLSATQP
jgi:hypothetical protein